MSGSRAVLDHPVSVAAVIETLMWLAVPYLVIGVAFTVLHPDDVHVVETRLQTRAPAGSDIAAFGGTTLLWPLLLATGPVEEHCDV